MPDSIKFTELPAGTLGSGSIFATAEEVGGGDYGSTKVSASEVGNFVNASLQYAALNTEDNTLIGAINELFVYVQNIANEYDSTSTYDEGDFCLYEGVLYKCLVDISVAEAWTPAHWTSTLIVDNFGAGGGASVTLGTTVPSDASGSNGDLYVQYNGTSYEVIEYYVKINNAWRVAPYSKVVALTQAQYDLITPDSQTLYIITDKQGSYVKLPVITDAWDSATSYTVGSYCIHNDTLWKCTTANTNQEPVSGSTYWDDTSVADEIALKANASNTYTKTEVDTALSGKQNTMSFGALTNTDLDTLRNNGYYYLAGLSSTYHAPCSYGVLEVIATTVTLQRVTKVGTSGTDATQYERLYINNAWTSWRTITRT